MGLYKLPLGIRIPKDNEYPKGYDIKAINDKRNSANIIEGFVIKEVLGEKFSHYAQINIDADKIWSVFYELTKRLIDDVAYGILGFKENESILSNFTRKEEVLDILEKYKFELTNDGYLEFGIANYDDISLNEVFVSSYKYMRVWTSRKEDLIEVLNNFGIYEVENIQFINEFPVVSQAISDDIAKGARHYSEVMESIEVEFKKF